MKKIMNLTLPAGLVIFLSIITIIYSPAAEASSRSSTPPGDITQAVEGGPDWFNEAWLYRRPVYIFNNGSTLNPYQVLIYLDDDNFDFSRANVDGSDVRIAYTDGTTELAYWIESWDYPNQRAYVWVKVPNLTSGSITVYLYYGNSTAVSASDGVSTFERFDDEWNLLPIAQNNLSEGIQNAESEGVLGNPFLWTVLSGSPTVASGILSLPPDAGIKSDSSHQYQAMGMRACWPRS